MATDDTDTTADAPAEAPAAAKAHTIYAPNRAFSGLGAGGVVFTDGVGATGDPAALQYFRDNGFGIDEPLPDITQAEVRLATAPTAAPGVSTDARDYAEPITLGSPLRDAAVDPQPQDFLPPTNAGLADPHGPLVVAPEIHASGPAGIRPGDVFVDEPARQEAAETALAQRILVEGETHAEANAETLAEQGDAIAPGLEEAPNRSANKPEWVAFAVARGLSEEEANKTSKTDLIERFGEG